MFNTGDRVVVVYDQVGSDLTNRQGTVVQTRDGAVFSTAVLLDGEESATWFVPNELDAEMENPGEEAA